MQGLKPALELPTKEVKHVFALGARPPQIKLIPKRDSISLSAVIVMSCVSLTVSISHTHLFCSFPKPSVRRLRPSQSQCRWGY